MDSKQNRLQKQNVSTKGMKWSYEWIDLLLGVILFTIIFELFIVDLPQGLLKFGIIFMTDLGIGLCSGILSYGIYRRYGRYDYNDLNDHSLQKYLRKIISSLVYAGIAYLALMKEVVSDASSFLEVLLIYGIVKLFIFYASEYHANHMLGKG